MGISQLICLSGFQIIVLTTKGQWVADSLLFQVYIYITLRGDAISHMRRISN